MNILSIDVGTSNIKANLYKDGILLELESIEVKSIKTEEGIEQDPQMILESINNIISKTFKKHNYLDEIILSTAMHSLIFLDEDYNLKSNMILWSDTRAEQVINKLTEIEKLNIYKRTGTPVHSMSVFSKLLYFKDKKINFETLLVSDLKSYLFYNLCGEFACDMSTASASGIWNLNTRSWDRDLLNKLEISINKFPRLREVDYQARYKYNNYTKITIGSTDGVMANRGVEYINPDLVISGGTSIGMRYISDEIVLSDNGKTFCYYAGFNQWLIGTASNNGGNIYTWIKDNLYNGNLSYERYLEIIFTGEIPDFVMSPYVYSERGPWWKSIKKSNPLIYLGKLTKEEITKSLFYSMLSNISILKESLNLNKKNINIVVTGGLFSDEKIINSLSSLLANELIFIQNENAVCIAGIRIHNNIDYEGPYSTSVVKEDENLNAFYYKFKKQMNLIYSD